MTGHSTSTRNFLIGGRSNDQSNDYQDRIMRASIFTVVPSREISLRARSTRHWGLEKPCWLSGPRAVLALHRKF